jgi:hypothetical protein
MLNGRPGQIAQEKLKKAEEFRARRGEETHETERKRASRYAAYKAGLFKVQKLCRGICAQCEWSMSGSRRIPRMSILRERSSKWPSSSAFSGARRRLIRFARISIHRTGDARNLNEEKALEGGKGNSRVVSWKRTDGAGAATEFESLSGQFAESTGIWLRHVREGASPDVTRWNHDNLRGRKQGNRR